MCFFCKSQSSSWLASFLNQVRLGAWMPGGNDLVEPIFTDVVDEIEIAKTQGHSHNGRWFCYEAVGRQAHYERFESSLVPSEFRCRRARGAAARGPQPTDDFAIRL